MDEWLPDRHLHVGLLTDREADRLLPVGVLTDWEAGWHLPAVTCRRLPLIPMKPPFSLLVFSLAALLAGPAAAQRVGDSPAAHDPFQKRTVAARVVPGGQYAGHSFVGNVLAVRGSDGSQLQIKSYDQGVVKVDYLRPAAGAG